MVARGETLVLLDVVAFLLGSAETVFDNASQAILPALVRKDQLERANGRMYAAEFITNQVRRSPLRSSPRVESRRWFEPRQAEASETRVTLTKKLAALADERQKLLRAYYANATPLELLRSIRTPLAGRNHRRKPKSNMQRQTSKAGRRF